MLSFQQRVYSGVYSGEQSYQSGLGHDREKNLAFYCGHRDIMTNSTKKIFQKQCRNFSNFMFVLDVLKKPTVSTLKMFKQDF